MPLQTRASAGEQSLEDLQQLIRDIEDIQGLLVNMGILDAAHNSLTFSPGDEPDPQKRTFLEVVPAGQPPQKAGASLICFGVVLIKNQRTPVAAYR